MSLQNNSTSSHDFSESEPVSTTDKLGEDTAVESLPKVVQSEARGKLALALTALGLAIIGQFYFSFVKTDFLTGVGFFAAGIVVFLILLRQSEPGLMLGTFFSSILNRILERIRTNPVKAALAFLSFGLSFTSVRLLRAKPGPGPYWDVLILWVISFIVYAIAFVRLPRLDFKVWLQTYRDEAITVTILTIIAAVIRFAALGDVPYALAGDEGNLGKLAVAVLNGEITNMMTTAYGSSSLFLFIMAGLMKLFGVNTFSLRLLSAISGTLTVPILYLFGRRLFNQRVALISAALLTVSNFHVHFSRLIVATGIQDALFATLGFYFFITGLERRSRSRLVLSGLIVGFAIYIYMGARLMIMLLPIYVLILLIKSKKLVLDNLSNLLAFAGAWLVISAPMINFAIQHTADFWARTNQIGVIQSGWLAAEAVKTGQSQFKIFLDLFKQAFLTVNYSQSWAFHLSDLPMLDFITGALFILGVVYSLYHVANPYNLLLNGWFWSGLLVGGALVINPRVNSYRILIVFPVVCLFVALAWDKLMELGVGAFTDNRIVRIAPSAVLIALFSFLNLKAYFIDYAPNCSYEDTNTQMASHLGYYINELGPDYAPYLVTYPRLHSTTYRSFEFLVGTTIKVNDIVDPLTGPPTFIEPNSKAAFFFTVERENELSYIQDYMPGGKVDRVYDCENLVMIAYVIPGD